jgi:hypothetical protein
MTDLLERVGRAKVDLLKLDIEGGEEALFTANYDVWIDRVQALIVEIHGAKVYEAIKNVMTTRGFTMQRQGEKLIFFKEKSSRKVHSVERHFEDFDGDRAITFRCVSHRGPESEVTSEQESSAKDGNLFSAERNQLKVETE